MRTPTFTVRHGTWPWKQWVLLVVLFSLPASAAESKLEKINVFVGNEGGYALYRIPGIVVTRSGTVLAYAEARRTGRSDWGSIDVLLRRSTDGGKTWGLVQHVAHRGEPVVRNPVAVERKQGEAGDRTVNNPVAIVDRQNGAVHFLYCVRILPGCHDPTYGVLSE